jgi:MtfA peptidase
MGWLRERRRRRIRVAPFPASWWPLIARTVPLIHRLPPVDREELGGHTQVLLAEKHFEGAGGLVITDEVRVTIAAQAAFLLLHRATDYFPRLVSIIVYPASYVAPHREQDEAGIVTEGVESRAGESWSRGAIVLSWDDVQEIAVPGHGARNVVLHEFAHQLDVENGPSDGVPLMGDIGLREDWGRVMKREYERLEWDLARGREPSLDPYAATNPAEFFAVATEAFFEEPRAMAEYGPHLYDVLQRYYRQDPASW